MNGITNSPYWADGRRPNSYSQPNRNEYDVIIIGGGLRGMAVLYWINTITDLCCLVIDRAQLGGRSTVRSLGMVNSIPDGSLHTHGEEAFINRVELASENRDLLRKVILESGADCDMVCNGGVHLSTGTKQDAQLELIQRTLSEHKYVHEVLTSKEILSLTGAKGFNSGLYYPRDLTVNPMKLLDFFISVTMINNRHRIIENTKVVCVDDEGSHVNVTTDGGTTIRAQYVVVCNNEMCDFLSFVPPHQFKLPPPKRANCVATKPIPELEYAYPMSCRTITGKNAWVVHNKRILYSCRERECGRAIDYMGMTIGDVQIASAFFAKYFSSLNRGQSLYKQYAWYDFYLPMERLVPIVGMSKASHRVIYNVGYDYSFLDIFFVCAKKIGLHLYNGSEIRLGGGGEEQNQAD